MFQKLILAGGLTAIASVALAQDITIYPARTIVTMEDSLPLASAVAVSDGRIVSVGTMESLQTYVDDHGARIDNRFSDKVLMPGFIDPHIHPSLPAVLTQFPFLAPEGWDLPTGDFPGALSPTAYITRLQELVAEYPPQPGSGVPFIAWGYHQLWHGDVNRPLLDELFGDTPVMLWHRSFHELIGNTAAFELLGVTEADAQIYPDEADWENGHFWENGGKVLVAKMPFLFAPDRYAGGMENFYAMLHQGGVTSAMDMGIGIFGDPVGEIELIHKTVERLNPPTRLVLTPIITDFIARGKSPQEALAEIESWTAENTTLVSFDNHFKLMMDGAIFSGLSQYGFPGYKDGHEGLWMAPLSVTEEWARFFWNQGFQLHAHTNGDKSAAALIEIVRRALEETPRFDHRTVLEHFAFAHEEQLRQMASLGIAVSANPYYQFILADTYAENWLGEDIARHMVPLGAAKRQGVTFGLHSDNPMAPLSPLLLVQTAVQRETIGGNANAENQAISVHDALRGITIDAAWLMRKEHETGSIRAGKYADFVVLEQNPYEVPVGDIGDIEIWGTVFEGRVMPVE